MNTTNTDSFPFALKKLIHEHSVCFLLIIFFNCFSVYIISFYLFAFFSFADSNDIQNSSSNYGDASTFATGLVSCLAITGGIFAVYLQHLELSLQRKELKDTRIELKQQKDEITKQTSIFKEEQFAQSFFNMFQIYKNGILNIHGLVRNYNQTADYQYIEYLTFKLNRLQNLIGSNTNTLDKEQKENTINKNTDLFCECYSMFISIIHLIDNSNLNDTQKSFYYSILQKVSLLELIWLALYSVTHSRDGFLMLERKNIFSNLKNFLERNNKSDPWSFSDSHWFDIFSFLTDCFGIT